MPTKILFGPGIVREEGGALALGKKPFLVTGKSSARRSGAWDDVLAVLPGGYEVFDQVENNPSVETVRRGGRLARAADCDYIIAIGGGSPLDAAKIIAVLAANDVDPLDLYTEGWSRRALPVAAIPTTAGTGSEVTQYAVLTIADEETKKGLGGFDLFPRVAYLDPRYTRSQPLEVTVDTAVDALSHLIEGYLARRAAPASDFTALKGLELWAENIAALKAGSFSLENRASLLLASTLGGITIAQTGTCLVHALGYSLTYFHGLPHGRANAVFLAEYLRYTETVEPQRTEEILGLLGLSSPEDFGGLISGLFRQKLDNFSLSKAEKRRYVQKAVSTRNMSNSRGEPGLEELMKIVEASVKS